MASLTQTADAEAAAHGRWRDAADAPLNLLVALAAAAAWLTPLVFSRFDDNRLVSWRWTFAGASPLALLPLGVACLALAYALAHLERPRRGATAWLCALAFAAAAACWSAPQVIVDSARYVTQAQALAQGGVGHFLAEWGAAIPVWTDLPLVPLLYGLVFSVFGEQPLGAQLLTTLLFAGTVALTSAIGRRLWSESVGRYAGALLLAMPFLLIQVPLLLVDVPAMFFLSAALYCALRAAQSGGAWRVLAAAAAAAALLTKYSLWPMLSVLALAFLVGPQAGAAERARRAAAVIVGAALLAGVFLLWKFDVVTGQLALLRDYQGPGLRRWQESWVSTLLFQVHPFVTLAALAGVMLALRRRDPRFLLVAWLPLLALAFGVQRSRYLLPVLPLLALMAAYALAAVPRARTRRFIAAAAVVSALAVALGAYLPFLQRTSAVNLKHAGEYLDALAVPRAEVVTLAQPAAAIHPAVALPLLDLHTRTRLVHRGEALTPPAGFERSALRFTWEFPLARAYQTATPEPATVVVIAAEPAPRLPAALARRLEGLQRVRVFDASDGVFDFQTFVAVYRRAPPS